MFCVIQFVLCLAGFVGCLAAICLMVSVWKEIWPCSVWEVLFLAFGGVVLCACAVLFVLLSMVKVVLV